MAVQTKFTIKRGQSAQDVAVSAGTAIAGGDAIEVNVDLTNLTEGDLATMIEDVKLAILSRAFPN